MKPLWAVMSMYLLLMRDGAAAPHVKMALSTALLATAADQHFSLLTPFARLERKQISTAKGLKCRDMQLSSLWAEGFDSCCQALNCETSCDTLVLYPTSLHYRHSGSTSPNNTLVHSPQAVQYCNTSTKTAQVADSSPRLPSDGHLVRTNPLNPAQYCSTHVIRQLTSP